MQESLRAECESWLHLHDACYRLTYLCLSFEGARLAHPWHLRAPTWTPPPPITCRREPFFLFFLFCSFVWYACVPRARHRWRAQHRRGCQQALTGRRGVGRSAVAVFVARSRVCIETRGKHEWVMSGLLVWGWIYYVRVYKGRFGLQNNIQSVQIFATKLKVTERAPQSKHQQCRAGERGSR